MVLPFSSFAGIGVYWWLKFFPELAFAVVTESGCAERRPSRRLDFAGASSCWGCAAARKDGFPFYWRGGRRDGSVGRVVGAWSLEKKGKWGMPG